MTNPTPTPPPTGLPGELRALLAHEPAVLAWLANGGLGTVLAFFVHLPPEQLAAVTTITTALASVYTAWRARPVAVSVLTGAAATIATAAAAFGLNISSTAIAAGVALLSPVLGLVFRANLTPVAKLTAPTTATPNP